MKEKFNTPNFITTTASPLLDPYREYLDFSSDEQHSLIVESKVAPEAYYFKIYRQLPKLTNGIGYIVSYKPQNEYALNSKNHAILIAKLSTVLTNWLKQLETCINANSIFDDPIIEAYSKEFEEAFSFVENPEQDFKPFPIKEQKAIINSLESIQLQLNSINKVLQNEIVNEAVNDLSELKANIHNTTKKSFRKKFFRVMAKVYKHDPILIKHFRNIEWLLEKGQQLKELASPLIEIFIT